MQNKYKFLAKNILIFTISSFSTKVLSFLLVPLYTSVLSTEEYGVFDFISTTISLLVPVLTVEIMSSVFIYAYDKKYNKDEVFTIGCKFVLYAAAIVLVFLGINQIFDLIKPINDFCLFFFLLFISHASLGVVVEFMRSLERLLDISCASAICSLVIILLNVFFLLIFKCGITGYFIANIAGISVQCLYLILRGKLWRYISITALYGKKPVQEKMLTYSAPLITNSIAWWINSASDRYIVVRFCGMAENGIYSVASKIPSILNVFQVIFSQAWTVSVVKEFENRDDSTFLLNIYNIYNFSLVITCSLLIISDKFIAKILYAKDFYRAWQYVPFLLIAIVFGSLSGFLGSLFSAMKESKILAKSTGIGASVNLLLNLCLTPLMGAMGAAVATTISYCLVWLMRIIHIKQVVTIHFRLKRDIAGYLLLLAQSLLLLIINEKTILFFAIHIGIIIFLLLLYKREFKYWLNKLAQYYAGFSK